MLISVKDLDVQKPATLYFKMYFKGKTYDMNTSATGSHLLFLEWQNC